jgi:hypothetical protein
VVCIFPNAAACLRLVRALAVEIDENWIEAMQYLNMEPLAEQKKEAPYQGALQSFRVALLKEVSAPMFSGLVLRAGSSYLTAAPPFSSAVVPRSAA